ncbi:MAG: WG repeat-containing protein [Bacteroidota bacterium]
MTRLAPLALLALLVSGCASSRVDFAAEPSTVAISEADVAAGERLFPMVIGGEWGYVDGEGREVILPRYEQAADFSEGRAAVREDGQWGYIAPSGQWTARPRYTIASPYSDGRARIATGQGDARRFGYLDPAGDEVIAPVLPFALDFSEGLALVRLTTQRRTALQRYLARIGALEQGDGFVFLTTDGDIAFEVEGTSAASFSGGLAPFESDRGWFRSTTWGYLDRSGEVAIPAQIDGPAFRHTDGLARAAQGGQVGFVDREGVFVIPPTYSLALAFSEGLAPVQGEDGLWGYVDADGALAIEPQFRSALPFSGGLAVVQTRTGWGYIAPDGSLVIPATYSRAEAFRNGLARVYEDRLLRYINTDGETVWAQP